MAWSSTSSSASQPTQPWEAAASACNTSKLEVSGPPRAPSSPPPTAEKQQPAGALRESAIGECDASHLMDAGRLKESGMQLGASVAANARQ
jgi:hypothetical protein